MAKRTKRFETILFNYIDDFFIGKDTLKQSAYNTFKELAIR